MQPCSRGRNNQKGFNITGEKNSHTHTERISLINSDDIQLDLPGNVHKMYTKSYKQCPESREISFMLKLRVDITDK